MIGHVRQFAFLGLLAACGSQASSATPPRDSGSGSDSSTAGGTLPQGDSGPPDDASTEGGSSVPDASLDATGATDSSMADGPIVGATTPFVSYEAEDGTLGGGATVYALQSAPTTEYSSPELEASGHAYVALTSPGQYVEWVNQTGQNITAFNVRYSIPDSAGGTGITATLNLYVNGQMRQALTLNSMQSWLYEGNGNYNGSDQNPADGDPKDFYDDMHTFLTGAALAPGDTLRLQQDAENAATFYYIDVIDLEDPPPPTTQPANSLSIEDYGAASGPATDSTSAIQNCIDAAQTQGKSVWIPAGTFYLNGTQGLAANGITIEGAGMWYSTIYRNVPLPNNAGGLAALFSVTSCTLRDFAIDSDARSRASVDGAGGSMDTTGTNWVAENIWGQHTESGIWASGTGGTYQNSRNLSMWADGCNINNVSLNGTEGNNLTVMNLFIRGTGDDALAINSVDNNGSQTYTPMANAHVSNNTTVGAWGGYGLAIYGGGGHLVENNYVRDTARFTGLGVTKFGANGSDLTSGTVTGNLVLRAGGNGFTQQQAALFIGNGGNGQGTGTVENVTISDNVVRDALYFGVTFSTSTGILLENTVIDAPGLDGIVIAPPFFPAPTGSATISDNTVTGLNPGQSAFANMSSGFTATLSGNSW
jgi:Right handed beta helix region